MNVLWQEVLAHPRAAITGAAIFAGLVSFFFSWVRQLGDFAIKTLIGFVFTKKEVTDDFTLGIVMHYLIQTKARRLSIARQRYDGTRVRPVGYDVDRILIRKMNSSSFTLLFWHGRPILHMPSVHGSNSSTSAGFVFLRWTLDWEQVLKDAAKMWDETFLSEQTKKKTHFKVVRHVGDFGRPSQTEDTPAEGDKTYYESGPAGRPGEVELLNYSHEDFRPPPREEPFEYLSITPAMQAVLNTVKFWYGHRDWYKRRGLSWRRGYLLYGKPGNGKTSLVRAIGEQLDIPVHIFDLASMDNTDFLNAWDVSRQDDVRICLFEDFDTVFRGRENVLKGSQLTFETILNAIDGIQRENGLLLFVTTNVVEHIDEALGRPDANDPRRSSRPGRLDMAVELVGLDLAGRIKMATRILEDEELATRMAHQYDGDTAAQFQERCVAEALVQLWGQQPSSAPPPPPPSEPGHPKPFASLERVKNRIRKTKGSRSV